MGKSRTTKTLKSIHNVETLIKILGKNNSKGHNNNFLRKIDMSSGGFTWP